MSLIPLVCKNTKYKFGKNKQNLKKVPIMQF